MIGIISLCLGAAPPLPLAYTLPLLLLLPSGFTPDVVIFYAAVALCVSNAPSEISLPLPFLLLLGKDKKAELDTTEIDLELPDELPVPPTPLPLPAYSVL
jgi:hypothetical protein